MDGRYVPPPQSMPVKVAAPHDAPVQQFLARRDLGLLSPPLQFTTHSDWGSYLCCMGVVGCLSSFCCSALLQPISALCGSTMAKYYHLEMGTDSLTYHRAVNDCCCHVAESTKTVPFEKITDVELAEDCCLTCFGLKTVNIQTAGQGGALAEICASHLAHPEQAREAVQLAMQLHRERARAPQQIMMHPGAMMQQQPVMGAPVGAGPLAPPPPAATAAPAPAPGGGLKQRLQALEQLQRRGALTDAEVQQVRPLVLAAPADPTQQLLEGADLRDAGAISQAEYEKMKHAWLARIQASAA